MVKATVFGGETIDATRSSVCRFGELVALSSVHDNSQAQNKFVRAPFMHPFRDLRQTHCTREFGDGC